MATHTKQGSRTSPAVNSQPAEASGNQSSLLESKALVLLQQGERQAEKKVLQQSVSKGVASASTSCNRAALYGMTVRGEAMIPLRQMTHRLKPEYAEALINLGTAHEKQGQRAQAIAVDQQR